MPVRTMRRSSVTGRLVSKSYTKRFPRLTVVERRNVNQKTSCKKHKV